MRRLLTLVLAPLFLCALPHNSAAQVNVSGQWSAVSLAGGSTYTSTFTLVQKGTVITGSAVAGGNPGMITGTISGNSISFHSDYSSISYFSDSTATTDGSTMSGSFLDSQGTRGTFTATNAKEPLSPDTVLSDPPVVNVKGDDVTFNLVKFPKALPKEKASSSLAAKSAKLTIQYEVSIKGQAKRKITSKKTEVTAKNLPPGNYSVSYQVSALKKDGKRVYRTKPSPEANFAIVAK